MNTVTKEFAVKVDSELAELESKLYFIDDSIRMQRDHINYTRASRYSSEESKVRTIAECNTKIDAFIEKSKPLLTRQAELNAEFKSAGGWNRAFLVINSNGHAHKNTWCSTCFDSTTFQWMTDYSNDDEMTIVEAAGEIACTVCYPTAPSEFLNKPTKMISREQEAKNAARIVAAEKKAAKDAKAAAAAPTAEGKSLIVSEASKRRDGSIEIRKEEIKTERTAVSYWMDYSGDDASYTDRRDACDAIVAALAGKNGITIEEQKAILAKKLAKRGSN